MIWQVFFGLVSFLIAFTVRVGTTHWMASALIFGDQELESAVKIYIVETLYNVALGLTAMLFFYGFGIFSPGIGGLLAFLIIALGGLAVFWQMIKYTKKTYETGLPRGAMIYIASGIAASLIIFILNLILGLIL